MRGDETKAERKAPICQDGENGRLAAPKAATRLSLTGPRSADRFFSEPNVITLFRLILSLVFFGLAVIKSSPVYNFIGLGVLWLGDVADGAWARRFKQETILGAEIDIIADRVEILFFYVNFLHFHPRLFLPVGLYIIEFAFIDFFLSYQFVKFGIISPNYFGRVDRTVYLLNYSPVAKFINSTAVTILLIFLPELQLAALAIAAGYCGIKIYSVLRLRKISRGRPAPESSSALNRDKP
jgi:CDP-diacylglycerol--glycerol-3-phosphate 3-phosphatidyltransferase